MIARSYRSWAITHPGAVRTANQDSYVDRPDIGLWAVADGAGGHQGGEFASKLVAATLNAIPPGLAAPELLAQVRLRMEAAHAALRAEAARRGPGVTVATTVVIMLASNGHYACLWAGDSRAYLLRAGTFRQVTRDHSLVQDLLDTQAITPEQAENHPRANVITRAVGAASDSLGLDKISGRAIPGDRFLLCSDGLCKTLADCETADLLGISGEDSPAARLIEAALARKARDNVTAVAVEAV